MNNDRDIRANCRRHKMEKENCKIISPQIDEMGDGDNNEVLENKICQGEYTSPLQLRYIFCDLFAIIKYNYNYNKFIIRSKHNINRFCFNLHHRIKGIL